MKKLAIASASLALAAVPVAGVFAASTEGSFTDNLTVTVEGGCTLEVSGGTPGTYADRAFSASITNGVAEVLNGTEGGADASAMEVTCNTTTPSAWHITATASNNGRLKFNDNYISGGIKDSGDVSTWAYSLDGTNWIAVPSEANAAITSGQTASGTPTEFNPSYRVYAALSQAPGTYMGSMTYTISMGSGS